MIEPGPAPGSQMGQDVFVRKLLPDDPGFFVEAGAADGVTYSNTLLFTKAGWRGLLVEPHPGLFARCVENRPESVVVNAVLDSCEKEVDFWKRVGYISGTVAPGTDHTLPRNRKKLKKARSFGLVSRRETTTLDALLDSIEAPQVIEYLSLDTEGSEDRILVNFPFKKYAFKVMTIERPKTPLIELLDRAGYVIIKADKRLDTFFVHGELMAHAVTK